jgi:triphosphoribosyl-dephospho-CoA synthase
MSYLATFPDSHIARKHGPAAAQEVLEAARNRERLWRPAARQETLPELLAFDRELKQKGLNPGTTADLVVATLYADFLINLG